MKKFLTVWITCSLALAGAAMGQQDEEQQKAKKEKKSEQANEAKPKQKQGPSRREHAENAQPQGAPKPQGGHQEHSPAKTPANENINANRQQGAEQRRNERAPRNEPAAKQAATAPAAATAQSPAAGAAQANKPNVAAGKKPDVQKIKAEHANFHAQPKPEKVPAVTFNQNYRINGANQWQGEKYTVFRSYHPEWHDAGWYHSHFNRVELIGGGYYFWNNGYWYPAWGYNPSAQYYAYDGPIYVGARAEPPDKVIADVQAALQEQGYYRGEVDGLLGPLTREALTAYQSDHGLYTTAAIDEPTLDSLGMG